MWQMFQRHNLIWEKSRRHNLMWHIFLMHDLSIKEAKVSEA